MKEIRIDKQKHPVRTHRVPARGIRSRKTKRGREELSVHGLCIARTALGCLEVQWRMVPRRAKIAGPAADHKVVETKRQQ